MKKHNYYLLALYVVLITYANGIVSTKFLNDINIQLQSLRDENKRITIPGFYDEVCELSDEERSDMAKAPFDREEFQNDLENELEKTVKTFSLNNKKQETNLIDALKSTCRKFTKQKTGKRPLVNINLVRI